MKWMGGWSYQDYIDCPDDLMPVILKLMDEEAQRQRASRRR
jgi:hypothetical protein